MGPQKSLESGRVLHPRGPIWTLECAYFCFLITFKASYIHKIKSYLLKIHMLCLDEIYRLISQLTI
jgi:hypothetical protein